MFVCRNGTWGRTGRRGRARACVRAGARMGWRARASLKKQSANNKRTKNKQPQPPSPPALQPSRFVKIFLLLQFIKIIICNHVFFGKAKGGGLEMPPSPPALQRFRTPGRVGTVSGRFRDGFGTVLGRFRDGRECRAVSGRFRDGFGCPRPNIRPRKTKDLCAIVESSWASDFKHNSRTLEELCRFARVPSRSFFGVNLRMEGPILEGPPAQNYRTK